MRAGNHSRPIQPCLDCVELKPMEFVVKQEIPSRFPSLHDMAEASSAGAGLAVWWGPVIGSDEPPADGIQNAFSISPCLVQDELDEPSDRRLKHSVSAVGKTVYGLPLYRFSYHDRDGVFEGVMADDVLKVKPSAVTHGPDGFYRVNYGELGLEFRQVA